MPNPKQLSRHEETQLKKAVEQISTLVADKSVPFDAAVKVATDNNLPPAMIRLACQAVNIGKVNFLRKQGSSLEEKFANPHPIDPQAVIDTVYSSKQASGDVVADIYKLPKSAVIAVTDKSMSKVAGAPAQQVEQVSESEKPPIWMAPEQYKQADIVKFRGDIIRAWNTKQAECQAARRDYVVKLDALAGIIKRATPESLAELREDASRKFGNAGAVLIDVIVNRYAPRATQRGYTKSAASSLRYRVNPLDWSDPVHVAVSNAYQAATKAATAQTSKLVSVLLDRQKWLMVSAPATKSASVLPPGVTVETERAAAFTEFEKKAIALGPLLGSFYGSTLGRESGVDPKSWKYQKAKLEVDDPRHEEDIRRVRIEAALHDLMNNDPIISTSDPREVVSAFNEISQSAPDSVTSPLTLRSNMRRLLQGDLATYEAQQLVDQEKSLRGLRTVAREDRK